MKKIKLAYLVILLFGSITNGSAWARGGSWHGGGILAAMGMAMKVGLPST